MRTVLVLFFNVQNYASCLEETHYSYVSEFSNAAHSSTAGLTLQDVYTVFLTQHTLHATSQYVSNSNSAKAIYRSLIFSERLTVQVAATYTKVHETTEAGNNLLDCLGLPKLDVIHASDVIVAAALDVFIKNMLTTTRKPYFTYNQASHSIAAK